MLLLLHLHLNFYINIHNMNLTLNIVNKIIKNNYKKHLLDQLRDFHQ